MKYIATISGGKDSVTMCDLLLKNSYPVDYIVFTDTLAEFGLMYQYIEKIKDYLKSRYGKDIIVTTPNTTFEAWCFGVINDEDAIYNGAIRGIPMVWSEPCYWRRESKVKMFDKFIEEMGIEKATVYIGYTIGEARKVKDTEKITYEYPLKSIFEMGERNCQEYLINQEMENPLYKYFNRTGCAFCPAQSEHSWYQVWKNFPDDWEYMKWVQNRLLTYQKKGMKVKNAYWFPKYKTCEQMERKFKLKEKQGTLFDLSDEPLKDCFCKI